MQTEGTTGQPALVLVVVGKGGDTLETLTGSRHCAFCLLPISGSEVKLCGKCGRRAYCSKACQSSDWKKPGNDPTQQRGQSHKDWCGLGCGEEDLDWKVAPIPGKGLGLVALRSIPPLFRIMVEGTQPGPRSHPKIVDLMPGGGSLEQKFQLNGLGNEGAPVLCLRLSRANHSCNPNAGSMCDIEKKTNTMIAERDIQPGEEICVNYTGFNWFLTLSDGSNLANAMEKRMQDCCAVLLRKWGIVCPQDCTCKDVDVISATRKASALYREIPNVIQDPTRLEDAFQMIQQILENQDIAKVSWIEKLDILHIGFKIAILRRSQLPLAQDYMNKICDITTATCHPKSARAGIADLQKYKNDLRTHPQYLALE